MEMKLYLLIIEGDVEPHVEGPYKSEEERLEAAKAHRAETDEDGVFTIDAEGTFEIGTFPGEAFHG